MSANTKQHRKITVLIFMDCTCVLDVEASLNEETGLGMGFLETWDPMQWKSCPHCGSSFGLGPTQTQVVLM